MFFRVIALYVKNSLLTRSGFLYVARTVMDLKADDEGQEVDGDDKVTEEKQEV